MQLHSSSRRVLRLYSGSNLHSAIRRKFQRLRSYLPSHQLAAAISRMSAHCTTPQRPFLQQFTGIPLKQHFTVRLPLTHATQLHQLEHASCADTRNQSCSVWLLTPSTRLKEAKLIAIKFGHSAISIVSLSLLANISWLHNVWLHSLLLDTSSTCNLL